MEKSLWEAIARLEPLEPSFVSVTYGAGGSTRERTHATVARLVQETRLAPAAHLTCVGASRREIDAVVRGYGAAGVRHIVGAARRSAGRPRRALCRPGERLPIDRRSRRARSRRSAISKCRSPPIPKSIRRVPNLLHDIETLKRKVDAGADRAITQFFFDNSVYFRFLDIAAAAGIQIPIVPGIVPVQNFKQTAGFAKRAGASVPAWLADRFEGLEDDPVTRRLVAAAVCAEQVIDLIDRGVQHLHFYTMNRADLVFAICHLIGLRARGAIAKRVVEMAMPMAR